MLKDIDLKAGEEIVICGASLPGVREAFNRELPTTLPPWDAKYADEAIRQLGDIQARTGRDLSPEVDAALWAAADAKDRGAFDLAFRAALVELRPTPPGHPDTPAARHAAAMDILGGAQ